MDAHCAPLHSGIHRLCLFSMGKIPNIRSFALMGQPRLGHIQHKTLHTAHALPHQNAPEGRQGQRQHRNTHALISRNEQRGRLAIIFNDGNWTAKTQADIAHRRLDRPKFRLDGLANGRIQAQRPARQLPTSTTSAPTTTTHACTYERGMLYDFPSRCSTDTACASALPARRPHQELHTYGKGRDNKIFRPRPHSKFLPADRPGSAMTDLELQMKWKF